MTCTAFAQHSRTEKCIPDYVCTFAEKCSPLFVRNKMVPLGEVVVWLREKKTNLEGKKSKREKIIL